MPTNVLAISKMLYFKFVNIETQKPIKSNKGNSSDIRTINTSFETYPIPNNNMVETYPKNAKGCIPFFLTAP